MTHESIEAGAHEPVEPAAQSLQERLQSNRRTIQIKDKVTLEIPGYGGLYAHYRILDFAETRAVGDAVEATGVKRGKDRELYLAAEHLIAANVGVEAHIDGEIHELAQPLGVSLAEYLGLGACENDRQAVFLIFRRELDVMDQFVALQAEKAYADREADKTALGESEAAG
jgi:hypothetical protein